MALSGLPLRGFFDDFGFGCKRQLAPRQCGQGELKQEAQIPRGESASRHRMRLCLASPALAILCLSGCFSKPQAVVYGRAATSISENLARVPIDVRSRRGLPEISGSVPLAGGFCLSAVREPEFLRNRKSPALAMHSLSVSSFPYGRDDSA